MNPDLGPEGDPLHPLLALALSTVLTAAPSGPPVYLGLDLEVGHLTSTSDEAIKQGAMLAIAEINRAGGVLRGRPLALLQRDNRSNPARGAENLRELAAVPDLVAVMGGKFSAVFLEQLPLTQELGVILLDPWAAADGIIDDKPGSFVFRLSLKDTWAMAALLDHARARGLRRPGLLTSANAWGRSSEQAARAWLGRNPGLGLAGVEFFNWGERSFLEHYQALRRAGADVVILVGNEAEGAILVKELAALPQAERLPILSHWGVTGGDFPAMCGTALQQVDLAVVQTFTFTGNRAPRAAAVLEAARRTFGLSGPAAIPSQVGLAHAYDLTRILARAIDLAGSTDRRKIRGALEQVRLEDGLVRHYDRPFTPERHEALGPEDAFLARWTAAGILSRVARP